MIGHLAGHQVYHALHHGDGFTVMLLRRVEFCQAQIPNCGQGLGMGEFLPDIMGVVGLVELQVGIGELIAIVRVVGKTHGALSQGLKPLYRVVLATITVGQLTIH